MTAFKHHSWESRTANKNHNCDSCGEVINKGDSYTCFTVKMNPDTTNVVFDSIKLHHIPAPCIDNYFKAHLWFLNKDTVVLSEDSDVVTPNTPPTTSEGAFSNLLKALEAFHERWKIEYSNSAHDRFLLLEEENIELYDLIEEDEWDVPHVMEEAGDILAVVLGTIKWLGFSHPEINFVSVMNKLSDKLLKRTKFAYKLKNRKNGNVKVTHWEKTLRFLTTQRDTWEVLAGPKFPHPEIRELLTEKEVTCLTTPEA